MQLATAHQRFLELNASVAAISADGPETSAEFAERLGLPFPLLPDPPRHVISAYGVEDRTNEIAVPAVFIVSQDGMVRWSYIGENPADSPSIDAILAIVEGLD